jgi:eukaryotic-like serine/threonine-protein kinase
VRAFSRLGQDTPWPLVAAIGVGALRGLAAAHERLGAGGVAAPALHGAIAPHHILVATNGVAKLADCGLAALAPRTGKLSYLAPELAHGGAVTVRAELYAMGAVIWEALTGVPLAPGQSDLDGSQAPEGELRALETYRTDLPTRLRYTVRRALSREPSARFASANEMASELAATLAQVNWAKGSQQDLGAAVVEANRAIAAAAAAAGELELTTSGVEFLPEGAPENPILLTQPAAEPLSEDDVLPSD